MISPQRSPCNRRSWGGRVGGSAASCAPACSSTWSVCHLLGPSRCRAEKRFHGPRLRVFIVILCISITIRIVIIYLPIISYLRSACFDFPSRPKPQHPWFFILHGYQLVWESEKCHVSPVKVFFVGWMKFCLVALFANV